MASSTTAPRNADDVDLEKWGDNIRFWRTERDLTQTQLADRVGAKQSTVSQWENGKRPFTHQQMTALARALRRPVRDLFPFPKDVR